MDKKFHNIYNIIILIIKIKNIYFLEYTFFSGIYMDSIFIIILNYLVLDFINRDLGK